MARIETDPNYTTPTFSRATAGPDIFKKEDVQQLAAAVSTHDHSIGKGVRLTSAAVTGSLDIADWFRSTGHTSTFAGSGTGTELYYDAGATTGVIQAYNRTTAALVALALHGAPISLNSVTVDASNNLGVPGALSVSGTAALGGTTVNGGLTVHGNVGTDTAYYIASGGARIDTPGGDMVRLVNSAQTVLDMQVGRNLTVAGNSTVSGAETVTGNINANASVVVATNLTITNGSLIIGPLSRRIYYSSGDQSLHFDWDVRIDSAHDVYTHTIHLVSAGDDCRIDSVGDMNYYGPNGSTNHRFHHVDGSWMGLQGAAFQVQSSVDHAKQFGKLIEPIADALDKVAAVDPVHYFHLATKSDGNVVDGTTGWSQYGFSAEQLARVLPEVADAQTGMIDFDRLVPVLWAAVRTLTARVATLEAA